MPEKRVRLPMSGWLSPSLLWRKTIITVTGSKGMLVGSCTAAGAADGFQYNGGAETSFNITTTESMNWIGGMFVAGTAKYFVGTIMEVVIWGRSLSPSELQAAHRALGAKWGISVP